MKGRIPVALLLLVFASVAGANQWLCIGEYATGFSYSEASQQWQSTHFRGQSKYVIIEGNNPKYPYEIKRLGEKFSLMRCDHAVNKAGYLLCDGLSGQFRFNKDNLRFLITFIPGFYNVLPNTFSDEESDTPSMEIGFCTKLD